MVRPDFVFRKERLAVFVDGCFWHGCPAHYTRPRARRTFWDAKIAANRARDRRIDRALRAAGWRVLHVWEHALAPRQLGRTLARVRRAKGAACGLRRRISRAARCGTRLGGPQDGFLCRSMLRAPRSRVSIRRNGGLLTIVATMETGTPLDLTNQELTSIEQYRLRRQTSVLVILFTDIKGFTEIAERRGDRHAADLLHRHDEIVVKAIEEGGAGLVVKHIGDSVMAVFAEPSTAVERALRIQEEIAAFNEAHPEVETIGLRIGLHMGQVAVENQAQFDLVGRHVNRASRVETLADAGQIYLTYPVFDSARGWLRYKTGGHIDWKLHGNYLLKGLEEPVEIYEVVDKRRQKPVPPKNARRKYKLFPVWLALGVLAVGAATVFGVLQYQRTEVYFTNWNRELTVVDQKQILALAGDRGQETRLSLTRLPVGRHLLQQDINYQVRNYMEIEIKRGMNVIPPGMVSVYLPALERRLDFQPGHEEQVEAQQTYTFPLYDKDNRRLDTTADLSLSIKGVPDPANPEQMTFRCTWKVVENGVVVGTDTFEMKSRATADDYQNRKVVIQADALHYWYLRTYTNRRSAELEIGAAYIEYKDK